MCNCNIERCPNSLLGTHRFIPETKPYALGQLSVTGNIVCAYCGIYDDRPGPIEKEIRAKIKSKKSKK